MKKYKSICIVLAVVIAIIPQITLSAAPIEGKQEEDPAVVWAGNANETGVGQVMQLLEEEAGTTEGQQLDTPSTPDTPDTPNIPDVPNTPDTPNIPDTPNVPETPQQPDVPSDQPSQTPEMPQQPQQPSSVTGGQTSSTGTSSQSSKTQTSASKKKTQTTSTRKKKKNTTKVSKVTGLTAQQLISTKVKLTWKKANKATGYYVYGKTEGGKYKLLKNTKKKSYTANISIGKKYFFQVVAYNKNKYGIAKAKKTTVSYNNKEIVSINHRKYTYTEMEEDIKGLCNRYKGRVSYSVIGKSVRGRNIYDVILGNPNAKKSVLVVSAIHAREYVTTVTLMKQLEYYLMRYNEKVDGSKPSDVFSKCCVHYVMMANPDGVTISQNTKSAWKANANGVNLNLNFSYDFDIAGSTADGSFTGTAPGSEPETKAIMKITDTLLRKGRLIVVNYHAMGNIVFGSYGGEDASTGRMIRKMYQTARSTTGYADASGYSGTSHGNYREYLSYVVNVPSITIEVGSTPCPLPSSSYRGIFERNKYVLIREARLLL